MTTNWGDYECYDPGTFGPLRELARRDARVAFDRLMVAKEGRIEALRSLLALNGIELADTDDRVQVVNDWFREKVQPDPDSTGHMALRWYAVVNDLGLFLGDVMIARAPVLTWQLFIDGKREVNYQAAVIAGFASIPNPKYSIDPARLVATYGHRIVSGDPVEENAFLLWIRSAESKA